MNLSKIGTSNENVVDIYEKKNDFATSPSIEETQFRFGIVKAPLKQ